MCKFILLIDKDFIIQGLNLLANISTVAAFIWGIIEFRALKKEQRKATFLNEKLIEQQKELIRLQTSHLRFIRQPLFQMVSLTLKSDSTDYRQSYVHIFFINEGATANKVVFECPDPTIRIISSPIEGKNSLTVIQGREVDVIGIIDLQIPEGKNVDEIERHIDSAKKVIPYRFKIFYEDEMGTKYSQSAEGIGFDPVLRFHLAKPLEITDN